MLHLGRTFGECYISDAHFVNVTSQKHLLSMLHLGRTFLECYISDAHFWNVTSRTHFLSQKRYEKMKHKILKISTSHPMSVLIVHRNHKRKVEIIKSSGFFFLSFKINYGV